MTTATIETYSIKEKLKSKIEEYEEQKKNNNNSYYKFFYSFEYFPPKTDAGMVNLSTLMENNNKLDPMWMDVTWGAGGSTADTTYTICESFAAKQSIMMHLTCTNMELSIIDSTLKKCKDNNIRNILALRGDPPAGQEWKKIEGGFANAVDLVRYIRKNYGDFFTIGVAGYPEGHVDMLGDLEKDIQFLKEKVTAGADLIITQLFYDNNVFEQFVHNCRKNGITIPIFPGIMPI